MKYSLVLPCKDEEQSVGVCIKKAQDALRKLHIQKEEYEIIVVDNNSVDHSATIAAAQGASVLREPVQGYGAALLRGFRQAKGEYIIMCDADNTYDLEELPLLIKHVTTHDIVVGNRFNKRMKPHAMPLMHRYIGNPFFSRLSRLFFKIPCTDIHSGFRVMRRDALQRLDLQSSGMEISSEMLIKATQLHLRIKEVNITYSRRTGQSKMRSFNDGWRHLKMMLLYSPEYLFLFPGSVLAIVGMLALIGLVISSAVLQQRIAGIHFIILSSILAILGYQLILLWLYTKTYRITQLHEQDRVVEYIHNNITLEKTISIGIGIVCVGIIAGAALFIRWPQGNNLIDSVAFSIFALTMIVIGVQTIAAGFMLSILGNRR